MIAALLATALAAPPGVYFEQTTVVRQQGAAPSPGVRSRVWCDGRKLRLEAGDAPGGPALLLRLDQGRVLRLDPDSRVATELDVARVRARSGSDASLAAGLMGDPGDDQLRTTRIGTPRTIAGHPCRGYLIRGRSLAVEAWVARDLPLTADVFAEFLEWSGATRALSGLVGAIRALPGFPLETRMRVSVLGMVQETVSTVTLLRVAAVPAERFEVPHGWRVVSERSQAQEAPR